MICGHECGVLIVLKIARAVDRGLQFDNFQDITSDHKSQNERAS